MKVLLLADQVQLKLTPDVLVLQRLVVTDVLHQFVEHRVRVFPCEHALSRVTLVVRDPIVVLLHIVFREELAFDRVRVCVFAPEIDHLHYLCFFTICGLACLALGGLGM